MIEQQTIVDQMEILRDGTVQVRLGLLLVDGANELDCKWHRTSVTPGASVDDQIAAVNAHLASMGRNPVDLAGIQKIKDVVGVTQTGEVVTAFAAAQKALAV